MEELSHLFRMERHTGRPNHRTTFKSVELSRGESIHCETIPQHTLLMQLSGAIDVRCDRYPVSCLRGWQMISIPKSAHFEVSVLEDTRLVLFDLSACGIGYSKTNIYQYTSIAARLEYDFRPTEIKIPLRQYLNLLLLYFDIGIGADVQEFKRTELYFCFKAFYSDKESAYLLHPVLSETDSFYAQIIRNNDNFTCINDMITATNMSRTRFFVKFKQTFGITAKQWMLKHRIQKIEHLASNASVSIKELMTVAGFDTHSQFYQFCRQHLGCSPSELIEK